MAEHLTDQDREGMVAGRWYMVMVLGGFTFIGVYCGALGFNKHKFKHHVHLANAGGLFLPDLCNGKWNNQVIVRGPFPAGGGMEIIQWHEYHGKTPWMKGER